MVIIEVAQAEGGMVHAEGVSAVPPATIEDADRRPSPMQRGGAVRGGVCGGHRGGAERATEAVPSMFRVHVLGSRCAP